MTSPGSFNARTRYLMDQVGSGHITAGCTVDQPYAQDQHETPYRHRSGRMKYLGGPLLENSFNFVDGMARAVITHEGSRIKEEMEDIAGDLVKFVEINAPKDTTLLSKSGSAWVEDNGIRTYEQPAKAPRRASESPDGWDRI